MESIKARDPHEPYQAQSKYSMQCLGPLETSMWP